MKVIPYFLVVMLLIPGLTLADDLAVDKVYHPYVQTMER